MTEPTPELFDLTGKRIYVAGHRGMVGSALVRRLQREPVQILTASRAELDLTRQADVEAWMRAQRPDVVIIAAAKVGGILANDTYPVDFLEQNLGIELNLIRMSHEVGVKKLLFLGSSCIYPRDCPQPIKEEYLLTGPLEPTNEWYATAKIAGIKLCQAYRKQYGADFISAMPTNLYGPGDNFDLESSHVVAALLRKMHQATIDNAPTVEIWGSGEPRREFLHVDDLADACLFVLSRYNNIVPINIGSGVDVSIKDLATLIQKTTGYPGKLSFNPAKPNGPPRKLLDISQLTAAKWKHRISLKDGLNATYAWLLQNPLRLLQSPPKEQDAQPSSKLENTLAADFSIRSDLSGR